MWIIKLVCEYKYRKLNRMNAFSNSIYFMVQLPCMKFSQSLHSHYLGSENSFGGCPVHWRIFSGILALYPQDVSSIQYSYDSRKCLQTLPNVPGGQNCPLVKNHCITVKWQALRRGTKLIKPWYHPRAILKKKKKRDLIPPSPFLAMNQSNRSYSKL